MKKVSPYISPESTINITVASRNYADFSFEELRKLFERSSNLVYLSVSLYILTFIFLTTLVYIISLGMFNVTAYVLIFAIVLFSLSAIGLTKRSNLGRAMGILVCIFFLFWLPFGTIGAIVCLVGLTKTPQLFGENRYFHKDLKAEFKHRKKANKLAKKAARA